MHTQRVHKVVRDGTEATRAREGARGLVTTPLMEPNRFLNTFSRISAEKRYTCAHPACLALVSVPAFALRAPSSDAVLPQPATEPAYFPTWTALQHHIRTAHPPTCPHASCNGRTFASHAGLRAHLKVHTDADVEAEGEMRMEMEGRGGEDSGNDEAESRPKKRRRGGEVGRDWRCEEDGCGKEFKSVRLFSCPIYATSLILRYSVLKCWSLLEPQKKALTTHHTITHLGRRDFVCPEIGCARAFGYKHILQRHVARVHAAVRDQGQSGEARGRESDADADADADADEECSDAGEARGGPSGIDAMTGRLYAQRTAIGDSGPTGAGMGRLRQLRCPYPNLSGFSSSSSPLQHLQGAAAACEYAFGRAYDLRRHLEAVHGVVLEKEIVDMWARRVRAGLARGS